MAFELRLCDSVNVEETDLSRRAFFFFAARSPVLKPNKWKFRPFIWRFGPTGHQHVSPGQRPGNEIHGNDLALKGRKKLLS